MSKLRSEKINLFGGGDDLQSVADEIYGGSSEIPDSGRVVARPTPIMAIWADVKQPRRAIPISIRMHWDGNPASVPDLLEQWHKVAVEATNEVFDMVELLNGEGEGLDSDKFPSVAQEYLALVRLAQGIKADGLINPITVVESDGKLLIESGERRWLAYHLLHLYLGEQWAKIPAAKGNGNDSVWRQATENTQRRQLNAIGMARQIALLIMAARGEEAYHPYEDIVKAGTSDRRFYAQVADGVAHPTPRGMGERIQSAMGLGKEQLSQYRALLRLTDDEQINDALWTRADVESWPESAIREVGRLTIVNLRKVLDRANWTLDDLRALKEAPVSKPFDYPSAPAAQISIPRLPVTSEWMHKSVVTKGNQTGKVIGVDGSWIKVRLEDDRRSERLFVYTDLTIIAGDVGGRAPITPAPRPAPSSVPGFDHDFRIGDKVRTRTGHEGEVVGLSGRLVTVRTKNGTNVHDHTLLTKIPAESKFVIGDVVQTRLGREGTVQGLSGALVIVKHPDQQDTQTYHENQLTLADDEPQINEADIEEDVDPDAPAPVREYREGWTDSQGGNNQSASDKADSGEAKRILVEEAEIDFLTAAIHLALSRSDELIADQIVEVSHMSELDAISLNDREALKPKLDAVYDTLTAYLASILQRVLDAAVS